MPQSMGLQRVGHDLATEQQQQQEVEAFLGEMIFHVDWQREKDAERCT